MDSKKNASPKKINIRPGEYNLLEDSFAVMIHDFQGNIIELNDEFCRMLGGYRDQLINKNIRDFIPEEAMDPTVMKRLHRHNVVFFKTIFLDKKGKKVHAEVNSKVLDEKKSLVLARAKDISREMQAKANSDRLNKILHAITDIQHLIVMGREIDPVLQQTCEILVDSRSYTGCGIGALNRESGLISLHSQAGEYPFEEKWQCDSAGKGNAPACIRESLNNGKVITIKESRHCDCKFKAEPGHYKSVSLPMSHNNQNIGIIHIAAKNEIVIDDRERELLQNISDALSVYISDKFHEQEIAEKNEKLKESEEKYYSLFTYAPLSYQSLDINGNILDVNPRWLSTLGYKKEEVIGKWFGDFLAPDFVEHFRKNFPRFKKAGSISGVQFKMQHKKGHLIYVEFEGCIGYNADGSFKQTYCVFKDITEEKKLQEELKASEKQYRLISENTSDGIIVFSADQKIKYASPAYMKITGYSEADLLSRTNEKIFELIHPDDRERLKKIVIDAVAEKKKNVICEYRFKKKNGDYFYREDNAHILFDKNNSFAGGYVICRDITERKNIEQEYKRLVENSPDITYIYKAKKGAAYWSPQVKTMLGFDPEQLSGDPFIWHNAIHPEDITRVKDAINQAEKGVGYELEYRIKDTNGLWHWLRDRSISIRNRDDEVVLEGVVSDITERKQKDIKLKNTTREFFKLNHELQSILDSLPALVFYADKHGNFLRVNKYMADSQNMKKTDMQGENIFDLFPEDEARAYYEDNMSVMRSGQPILFREEPYATDQEKRWVSTSKIPFKNQNGQTIGIIGISIDITEQKLSEKKLIESEKRYRSLFNDSLDAILLTNNKAQYIDANPAALELLGYSLKELKSKTVFDLVKIENKEAAHKIWKDFIKSGMQKSEIQLENKKGDVIIVDYSAVSNIMPGLHVSFLRDITKQKITEKKLLEKNEQFELAVNGSNDGIWDWNLKTGELYLSPQWKKQLGYKETELENYYKTFEKLILKEDKSIIDRYIEEYIAGKRKRHDKEIRMLHKNGTIRWIRTRGEALFDEQGNLYRMAGSQTDITDRKMAEEEIRKSEAYLKSIFRAAPAGIGTVSNRVFDNVNETTCQLLGYSRDELLGQSARMIYPTKKDYEYVGQEKYRQIRNRGIGTVETRLKRKDGKIIDVIMSSAPIDSKNTTENVTFSFLDISDRKKTEQKLRQQTEQFRLAVNGSNDGIWDWNIKTNELFFSPRWKEQLGYRPEELENRFSTFEDLIYPEDLTLVKNYIQDYFAGKIDNYDLEFRMMHKEGGIRWIRARGTALLDKKGTPYRMAGSHTDITGWKRAEEELKASKTLLDATGRLARVGGWQLDVTSKVVSWTEETYRIHELPLDYSPPLDEAINYFHPDDRKTLRKAINEAFNGKSYDLELRFTSAKGKELWTHTECHPVFENGKVVKLFGTFQDITDRKIAEEKLKSSNALLSSIMETSPVGITTVDKAGVITYANQRAEEILELKKSSIRGVSYDAPIWNHTDLDGSPFPDEKQPFFIVKTTKQPVFGIRHGISRKKGKRKILSINAVPMLDQQGHFDGMVASIEDITQRRKIEQELEKSEQKFRLTFKTSPDSINLNRLEDGVYIDINKGFTNIMGYTPEDVIGKSSIDIKIWKNLDDRRRLVKGLKEKGTVENLEAEFIAKDGTVKYGLMSSTIIEINNEKVNLNITRDITKRKELENEIRTREERFHNMLRCIPDMVSVHDLDFNIIYSNWNGFGAVPEDKRKLGSKCYKILRNSDIICPDCQALKVMKTKEPYKNEVKLPNGSWVDLRIIPLLDKKGRIYAFMEWVRDITSRKQNEQKLANSEKKIRDLFNNLPLGIFTSTFAGEVLSANPAMAKIYGFDSVEELLKRDAKEYYVKSGDRKKLLGLLKENKVLFNYRTKEKKRDGEEIWVETDYKLNYDEQKDTYFIDGIADDVTVQTRKEEELRQLSTAVKQNPAIIVITSLAGRIEYVNPKFCELTGYQSSEVIGDNPRFLKSDELPPEVYQELWQTIVNNETWRGEFHNRRKDGTFYWESAVISPIFDEQGKKINYIKISEDITKIKAMEEEKEKMEKQRQTSQKLETIGTMAGGIAHDFNNILTPILGYSGLIKKHSDKESQIYDEINEIFNAGLRAKDLISQILNFSRQTETQKTPLKIHLILKEAIKLMRPTIPAIVSLKVNVDKECRKVMVDGSKLHQVFVNICTNAVHAVGEKPGTISISMQEVAAEEEQLLQEHQIHQGRFCKLTFADTGCGIEQGIIDRIFDPFFTTKEQGKGTGLGLSVVHGIIKEHDGEIFVESESGKGSAFYIYLPVVEDDEDSAHKVEDQQIIKGDEHILVVDDRPDVIKMASRLLSALGYEITAFSDPEEAYHYYRDNAHRVDLLFTDYSMPKMSGLDLAEKIRAITPDIPVIIATGNTEKINRDKAAKSGINKIINKPLMIFEVSKTIREILDHKKGEQER